MMNDVKITAISKIYAKALFDSANEKQSLAIKNQILEIIEIFNSSEDLRIVMNNSSISLAKKLEILDEVFSGKFDCKLVNLLKLLVEKNRFNELESINAAYEEMIDIESNIKKVVITSPIKLNFENKTNVLFKLEHKLGCEIQSKWVVDESIIAGLVFKFDDRVIDTSIRAKLENLSKKIMR